MPKFESSRNVQITQNEFLPKTSFKEQQKWVKWRLGISIFKLEVWEMHELWKTKAAKWLWLFIITPFTQNAPDSSVVLLCAQLEPNRKQSTDH